MKISDLLNKKTPTISFELFPPKTAQSFDSVADAAREISGLAPSFMSITYGAGGGTCANTVNVAGLIQNELSVTALAHLTCVSSQKNDIDDILATLGEKGVENILALRGDKVDGAPEGCYKYAHELVTHIKNHGGFCVGAACYPEGHPESETRAIDIEHIRHKVDCGCSFLTTQMFFDNNILYNYMYRLREGGVTVPVVAGIMPVTSAKQIKRICTLSGTYLPERFKRIVDCFGQSPVAMQQAGIAYAAEQIIDLLANGVRNIHVYSMNRPAVARGIVCTLSEVLKTEC